MNATTPQRTIIALALLGTMGLTGTADAAPLFTVTDLGSGYQLQQDATGSVQGVTNADGSRTYTFDKSPVIQISERHNGGSHADSYTQWTMQSGSNKVGYNYDYGGGMSGTPLSPGINYPTLEPWSNGWFVFSGSPVSDLNSHGQVVGTSVLYSSLESRTPGPQTYAAFSDLDGYSHGFGAATVDNLNHYIASDLGVYLTAAIKIDDLGQIIAIGTIDGKNSAFLLTPDAMPTPAPEPTTLALLAVASIGGLIRRRARRR